MTPRGLRNNNPGNLRISKEKWQGEIQPSQDKEFKQFESMSYGYRAMFKLLRNYQKFYGLNTVRLLIHRYAPTNENHTDNYVEYVAGKSFVLPDETIDTSKKDTMIPIVCAMSQIENGIPANLDEVKKGWELL